MFKYISAFRQQFGQELKISRFVILFTLTILAARPIHAQATSQPDDAFIAGCATGAFDSYSALKSNCPKQQSETTTVLTQPLAYTPQQLDEMNRYAREGAAALQQYLQKSVTPLSLPATGDAPSFLPNTRPQPESIDYHPIPIYPVNGNSGGVLAGIAKAAEAYQQRSASFGSFESSLKLAQAQKELEKLNATLAQHTAWIEFRKKREATREAASQELAEAMRAGTPVVKSDLTLDEAKNLQSQLRLDPHQKHIFPDILTVAVDSKGEMHFDPIGLPIEEFRYTLVGDLVTPHEQEMIRARSWQGFENVPSDLIFEPLDAKPDLASTMDWLRTSSVSAENRGVHIGAADYITSVFSPLVATKAGEGRIVVVTMSTFFRNNFDHVEVVFNIRDIDSQTVALRKSPHGDFYIFTARTANSTLKIYDRTHDQGISSIAFEIAPEYGPRFAEAFKRAVILAHNDKASLAAGEKETPAQPEQPVQRRNDWAARIFAQEQKPVQTWGAARRYCSAHPDGSIELDVIFTCTIVNHYRLKPSELDLTRDNYDQESDSFGARQ